MGEDYSSGSDDGQFDKTRSSLTRKLWLSYTDLLASSLRLPGGVVIRPKTPKTWSKGFLNI